jgi:predicted AAA+ superfamily ATPase
VIERIEAVATTERLLRRYPVVAVLGARQVGKTTLAREIAKRAGSPSTFLDLENRADLGTLEEPLLTLARLRGLVVIDEVQRRPDLFPTLRVLADRPRHPARFLVLGSAAPALLRQSSESLAGRIAYVELGGDHRTFRQGRIVSIPGASNRMLAFSVRLAPRFMVRKVTKKLNAAGHV